MHTYLVKTPGNHIAMGSKAIIVHDIVGPPTARIYVVDFTELMALPIAQLTQHVHL